MNIIFMRHGEATDNVKELISDKEIYWSVLTKDGEKTIKETIDQLPKVIDKVYVSPLPRTIQTASLVKEKYCSCEYIIDDRIREINHGKYSGKRNNQDLDKTRESQVAGDYFIRFGEYGENKFDIENRLTNFLEDVFINNFDDNTILIISHGSVISFMKRILKINSPHIKVGKAEIFDNVKIDAIYDQIKCLANVRTQEISRRLKMVSNLGINNLSLQKRLRSFCKKEFNNIEFSQEVFNNYISGLTTNNLKQISSSNFEVGVILICFYNNFQNFASNFMKHYYDLGVKNFVMINNNSSDGSYDIINSTCKNINIDNWQINEKYNCFKMCGWRQQIIEHYGAFRTYLFVDSDELLIYDNYKNLDINSFIEKNKLTSSKSVMIDVYSKEGITDKNLDNYKYADYKNYKISTNKIYGQRIYGGYRSRLFSIRPSLQKISILRYTGNEILINDHFYYPWIINKKSKIKTFLLHYKFLCGDIQKYKEFAEDGRHWNNSREYKVYVENIERIKTFYDEKVSKQVNEVIDCFKY